MAIVTSAKHGGRTYLFSTLLSSVNTVYTTSDWTGVNVVGGSVHVEFSSNASADMTVNVSNNPTEPATVDLGVWESITTSDVVTLCGPILWVKATVRAFTSGDVSAFFIGAH